MQEQGRWVDVFEPGTRRLAFRLHLGRGVVEIQRRGEKRRYSLAEYGLRLISEAEALPVVESVV